MLIPVVKDPITETFSGLYLAVRKEDQIYAGRCEHISDRSIILYKAFTVYDVNNLLELATLHQPQFKRSYKTDRMLIHDYSELIICSVPVTNYFLELK
jgi:hypothetical protein